MKTKLLALLLITQVSLTYGQSNKQDSVCKKHFISTSVWSIANVFAEPADFYELNYGYIVSDNNAIIVNATTWKYWEPLGIPLTSDKRYKHIEDYAGYIRAYGIGIAYQRVVWKQAFSSVHANTFYQIFYDTQNMKIQTGFQLYLQARVGYSLKFFNDRLFLEPSISFIYWPVNTNFPDTFLEKEQNWPNYLLFEPHLNIGISF